MDTHDHGRADHAARSEEVPVAGASPVSHDMEGIFGQAAAFPDREASARGRTVVPIVARGPAGRRLPAGAGRKLVLPGAVLAAVLAVSIGVIQRDRPEAAPKPAAEPLHVAAPSSPEPRQAVVTVVPRAVAEASQPAAVRSRAERPVARLARTDGGRACGRLERGALARCMRPQILAADRQLRQAYRHAARRGVDRDVMAAYRDRWSSLRRRANSDPRRVVAEFRQMAHQLDARRG